MKRLKYVEPELGKLNFNCPSCSVLTTQNWFDVTLRHTAANRLLDASSFGCGELLEWRISKCTQCDALALWHNGLLFFPDASNAPLPADDMPDDVLAEYEEAARVVNMSPRSAAALLRLSMQRLMVHLGEPGKRINDDVAALVTKGLPVEIQQALDALRVIGNNAVHPGELGLTDDAETAHGLFDLVNFVVEDRISRPGSIGVLYARLPESARRAIDLRDRNTRTPDGETGADSN